RSYTSKHDCITGIGILYGDTVVGTCRNDGRSPYIADPSTRYTRTDYAVRCRTARNSSYQSIAAVRLALGLQVYVVLSQLGMNPYGDIVASRCRVATAKGRIQCILHGIGRLYQR